MLKHISIFALLAALLAGPIILGPKGGAISERNVDRLVIITPHNEAIRYEFARAFEAWHLAKSGKRARVDWRTPGGTSEIARYVASEYFASFQNYWTRVLRHPWNKVVEASFSNPKVELPASAGMDSKAAEARRAFLNSNIGCGIDLFFGGGAFDFEQQARTGILVDCGYVSAHPEIFNDRVIPRVAGGEPYWDARGRWIGAALSSFGICYNTDVLSRLGVATPPVRWADLAAPIFAHEIALANPTQSGSVNKAIEMLVQQQMMEAVKESNLGLEDANHDQRALSIGWERAMQMLMKIGANARYFTDASAKIALDVDAGEAAAGMTIDFYGRFQSEAARLADGSSRVHYVNAEGGTSAGVDPIGLFRGAAHPETARAFIEFVLSQSGQKLWNWKAGIPGGPQRYSLRRLPILPALYASVFRQFRSDPDVNPYALPTSFNYHGEWTGPLFRPIAFIVRVMCIDSHEELADAWKELGAAGFPSDAMDVFENVRSVSYLAAFHEIRNALAGDKIQEVRLAKKLSDQFRAQYRSAAKLARAAAAAKSASHSQNRRPGAGGEIK